MLRSILLRPSVLASVAAHAVVGVALVTLGGSAQSAKARPAEAWIVFASSEVEAPVEPPVPAYDAPSTPDVPVEEEDPLPLETPPEVDGALDDMPPDRPGAQ